MQHGLNPVPKSLPRLGYRLTIHPRGRVARDLTQIPPHPLPSDVMRQGGKPELWLTPSFRCYSFESRCHGWRFFSLHRRPFPPVVWSPCRPRTIQLPLAASPGSRFSRPQSTISQSDFRLAIGSSSRCWLVGPYKLKLEPDGSPLFAWNPLAACWRFKPRKHPRTLAFCASWNSAFPLER